MDLSANVDGRNARALLDAGRLQHLFSTRPGDAPPLIAGRTHEQSVLSELLSDLAAGRPGGLGAVLFGPRGNGKTVLLKDATSKAQSEHGIDVVSFTPSMCPTTEALNEEILRGVEVPESVAHTVQGGGSVGLVKGQVAKTQTARLSAPNTTSAVQERIQRSDRPLVIAVDEAHRLDTSVGEALLNAVQSTGRETKAAVALLAGTPDLVDHIRRMNATFFLNRVGEGLLPMGLIPDDEAVRAVAEPLRAAGLEVDPEAEQAIRESCAGYPYFTQLLGRAVAESSGLVPGASIPLGRPGDSACSETLNRFLDRKKRHYEGVWSDLREGKLISCAFLLGEIQVMSPDGRMPDQQVELAIDLGLANPYERTAHPPDYDEAMHRLNQLGLLWSPSETAGSSELGIPSFFDYLTQEVRRLKPELAGDLHAAISSAIDATSISAIEPDEP